MGKTTQKKRLAQLLPAGSGRWPSRGPIELPLFDNCPSVTADDIDLWMNTVARRISADRRERYVINYNVAGKIAAAKLSGQWPPLPQGESR